MVWALVLLAVTNAADFSVGLPNRGSLASIFLTGLDAKTPLQVKVAGLDAPVLAAADLGGYQQVNIQVPMHDQQGASTLEVIVEQGTQQAVLQAPVQTTSPGQFFQTPDRRAVVQHGSDYSLVTPENPAIAGEALVGYLTGMPDTKPLVKTGEPAPFDPLAIVPQYNEVWGSDVFRIEVAGAKATPFYVGLAPGLLGVYQINFVMPSAPAGLQTIQLVRVYCRAFFGSCAAGGGVRNESRSSLAGVPVK